MRQIRPFSRLRIGGQLKIIGAERAVKTANRKRLFHGPASSFFAGIIMVNHTILQGVKSILQGVKSMPPARFCAAGPALINRKRHKTPPPFPQPKQECKPRFICHKALNFPSTIFQANSSTPTPGQNALSAPHLLQPVLSQRLKRTENPSQHLLHPISALLFDEKREPRPAQLQHNSSAAVGGL